MKLSRDMTNHINWCLDNLVPPIVRDCRPFMYFVIWFAYGEKTKHILDFKEKYPTLSDKEINAYYDLIQNVPINDRLTDLNKKSIQFVLENLQGSSIVDVACGRGYLAEKIAQKGFKVTGIDIVVPERSLDNVTFVQGSLLELPLSESSFDTVLCTHALEHIRNSRKALQELFRVAKKKIIIVVPKQREYIYTPDLHVNFFPYLYRFKEFIGIDNAKYFKVGNDFICVIDVI